MMTLESIAHAQLARLARFSSGGSLVMCSKMIDHAVRGLLSSLYMSALSGNSEVIASVRCRAMA